MLADVLLAPRPRPELAAALGPLAGLVGDWDLTVEEWVDGERRVTDAEWHFGWGLDGHALLDVWISPARASRGDGDAGEWGLSVRFYDPRLGAFRSTWHGPRRGWVLPFTARSTADGLLMTGRRDEIDLRWRFSALEADRFAWQAEERAPGGDWTVRQRFAARRMAARPDAGAVSGA